MLAKLYEHQLRNLRRALAHAERSGEEGAEQDKRLRRLRRKIDKAG